MLELLNAQFLEDKKGCIYLMMFLTQFPDYNLLIASQSSLLTCMGASRKVTSVAMDTQPIRQIF